MIDVFSFQVTWHRAEGSSQDLLAGVKTTKLSDVKTVDPQIDIEGALQFIANEGGSVEAGDFSEIRLKGFCFFSECLESLESMSRQGKLFRLNPGSDAYDARYCLPEYFMCPASTCEDGDYETALKIQCAADVVDDLRKYRARYQHVTFERILEWLELLGGKASVIQLFALYGPSWRDIFDVHETLGNMRRDKLVVLSQHSEDVRFIEYEYHQRQRDYVEVVGHEIKSWLDDSRTKKFMRETAYKALRRRAGGLFKTRDDVNLGLCRLKRTGLIKVVRRDSLGYATYEYQKANTCCHANRANGESTVQDEMLLLQAKLNERISS